jgi:hypothetical protein
VPALQGDFHALAHPPFPAGFAGRCRIHGLLPAAHADTLKSETEVRALADKVMAQAGAGRTDDAYGLLSRMRWWTSAPSRARTNARSARMAIEALVGNSVGYEFIRSEKVGESLLKLTYIEKTERQAIPWMFIFYKAPPAGPSAPSAMAPTWMRCSSADQAHGLQNQRCGSRSALSMALATPDILSAMMARNRRPWSSHWSHGRR